jgi:murein DD-endopeptidase MepM/ murein hydrolase activator NlpD
MQFQTVNNLNDDFIACLKKHRQQFKSVLPPVLQHGPCLILNLNGEDSRWLHIDYKNAQALYQLTLKMMQDEGANIAIGKYAEDRRFLYRDRDAFQNDETLRSIHLGIDLTVPVATPIFSPLDAQVFTVNYRPENGDYGSMIILEHQLEEQHFYTLYGHLCQSCCPKWQKGERITAGQQIACIGAMDINGGWPPHLHFQIIRDLAGYTDDFPGIIDKMRAAEFLRRCPDPNLILNIAALGK